MDCTLDVNSEVKKQVLTILDLIDRIVVAPPGTFLVLRAESKPKTEVNPSLADLGQAPYTTWKADFGSSENNLPNHLFPRESARIRG